MDKNFWHENWRWDGNILHARSFPLVKQQRVIEVLYLLVLFELCKWDTTFGAEGFKATKRHHLRFHGVARPFGEKWFWPVDMAWNYQHVTRQISCKTQIDKLRNFWTTASVNSTSRGSFKEHKEHFLAGACSFNCSVYSQISVDVTMCCTDKPKGLNY